jgi:hypothetical protein
MIGHSAFPTKRGELSRLYVKQVESAHVDEFKQDGLALRVGLSQLCAPTGARHEVVEIDEHVVLGPALGDKPLAERKRDGVVVAGMGDEKTRQTNPR